VLAVRRRNLEVRAALRRTRALLRAANSPTELFSGITHAAAALEAEAVRLRLGGANPDPFSHGFDRAEPGLLLTRHPVGPRSRERPVLEFAWNHGRTRIDRDTEIAVEQLCHEVDAALGRLGPSSWPWANTLSKVVGLR
jgi:hypothetical protein